MSTEAEEDAEYLGIAGIELPLDSEEARQQQIDKLEKLVEKLESRLTAAIFRVQRLESAITPVGSQPVMVYARPPAVPIDTGTRKLPRGKYEGKTYKWVIDNDPWYVQWLSREGKAAGLGFTEDEEQEAIDDPRPQPRSR